MLNAELVLILLSFAVKLIGIVLTFHFFDEEYSCLFLGALGRVNSQVILRPTRNNQSRNWK